MPRMLSVSSDIQSDSNEVHVTQQQRLNYSETLEQGAVYGCKEQLSVKITTFGIFCRHKQA